MKKLAGIFVRYNVPDYMIWVHNTSVQHPAYLTFSTCTLSGEIVAGQGKFKKNHVDVFADKVLAETEFNAKSWGIPIAWFGDLKKTFYDLYRKDAPLSLDEFFNKYTRTYLAMPLLYDGLIDPHTAAAQKTGIFRQVMEARYQFGMGAPDVFYNPHGRTGGLLTVESAADVRVSVYTRSSRVFVAAVNFSDKPASARLRLDRKLIADKTNGGSLFNNLQNSVLPLDSDGSVCVTIEPSDFLILTGEKHCPIISP
jgi:hypothetical protein